MKKTNFPAFTSNSWSNQWLELVPKICTFFIPPHDCLSILGAKDLAHHCAFWKSWLWWGRVGDLFRPDRFGKLSHSKTAFREVLSGGTSLRSKNRMLKCWRPRSCFQLAPLARFPNFFGQKSSVNNELQVRITYNTHLFIVPYLSSFFF